MWDIIFTHEKYASRYDGVGSVFEIRHTDKRYKPQWEKFRILADHINDGYDYLMWMDDDAGFVKFDVDFRDFLPGDGKLFYFTREAEEAAKKYHHTSYLNTGVFFVKCCDENKKTLEALYEKRHTHNERLQDQPEIIEWFKANSGLCGLLDPVLFNSTPYNYKEFRAVNRTTDKSLIVHLFSYLKTDKIRAKYFGNTLIVSVATYKPRMKTLGLFLRNILGGTMRPFKFVLNVYKDDVQYLTPDVRKLVDDKKVELNVCEENLKPHNKYYWVMKKYPNNPILTLDDDMLYSKDFVECMYNSYIKQPLNIHAVRCHKLTFGRDGRLNDYSMKTLGWECRSCPDSENDLLFLTGGGGVLYPPGFLKNETNDFLNVVRKHISVDDNVLTWWRLKNGYKITLVKHEPVLPNSINNTQSVALSVTVNSGNMNNNKAIRELLAPILETKYGKREKIVRKEYDDDWED